MYFNLNGRPQTIQMISRINADPHAVQSYNFLRFEGIKEAIRYYQM